MKALANYARMLFAAVLLPSTLALGIGFYNLLINLGENISANVIPFWIGLGTYLIFQGIFFKPIRTYVFGHELTHALVGLLSGARLKSFKVSRSGGSVVLSKTNVWIALAPYFLPLYTIILISAFRASSLFTDTGGYVALFLFLCGFTLSFHLSLTNHALRQGQSDLKSFGVFFSSVFIIIVNFLVLAAILKLMFPGNVGFKSFLYEGYYKTVEIWSFLFSRAQEIWHYSTLKN
jgi:hypothetical protein